MKPLFIAEVKTRSPFGFESKRTWPELLDLAIEHGDLVAVHTDVRWGGSFGQIEAASRILDKVGYPKRPYPDKKRPLLVAKGIHASDEDIRDALYCGADLVTVVGRIPPPELAPVCIWEPTNLYEITRASDHTQKIMWNARDLATGKPKVESFDTARWAHKGWMVQASFIEKPEDVHPKANAFIVGEHLPTFVESP